MVVVAQDVSGMARGHRHLPLSRTAAGDGSASPGRFAVTTAAKGLVYRVFHRGSNINLAVKIPQPGLFETERQKGDFNRECETWINLGLHPHIVSWHYVRTLGGDSAGLCGIGSTGKAPDSHLE